MSRLVSQGYVDVEDVEACRQSYERMALCEVDNLTHFNCSYS